MDDMTLTDKLRALLDECRIAWVQQSESSTEYTMDGVLYRAYETYGGLQVTIITPVTPKQAITATVGPTLDQDLQQALDFMRIWITDDAHLGESDISYELEKAEGLRNLEAIEQAIAATVGMVTCRNISDPPNGFLCSECGWGDFNEPTHLLKYAKYCPNCGKRIEVDE